MTEGKSEGAFRTIGELSADLGVPQHILRYWETRFPQLRPLTRAGNRRYYRPEDVALVRRIHQALNNDGFTIKGVQKLLANKAVDGPGPETASDFPAPSARTLPPVPAPVASLTGLRPKGPQVPPDLLMRLTDVRDQLVAALAS